MLPALFCWHHHSPRSWNGTVAALLSLPEKPWGCGLLRAVPVGHGRAGSTSPRPKAVCQPCAGGAEPAGGQHGAVPP